MNEMNSESGSSSVLHEFDMVSSFSDITCISETAHHCIYTAHCRGQLLVLKAVNPASQEQIKHQQLLQREYEITSRLDGYYTPKVWQMVTLPDIGPCLVMEYINARTLTEFLKENPSRHARYDVLMQILAALDYIHKQQLVHADLKPANILLTTNGNHLKLIDFGYADAEDYLFSNIGHTRSYAAPEQLHGGSVDARTDIFAVGKLIDLLFPQGYWKIKRQCTNHSKDKRYPNVVSLQRAIRRWHVLRLLVLLFCCIGAFVALLLTLLPSINVDEKVTAVVAPQVVPHIDTIYVPQSVIVEASPIQVQTSKPVEVPIHSVDPESAEAQHAKKLAEIACADSLAEVMSQTFEAYYQHYLDRMTRIKYNPIADILRNEFAWTLDSIHKSYRKQYPQYRDALSTRYVGDYGIYIPAFHKEQQKFYGGKKYFTDYPELSKSDIDSLNVICYKYSKELQERHNR